MSEKSYESDQLQNGYFTYFLIEALKKGNGMTPVAQMYAYIRDDVAEQVKQQEKMPQTPALSMSD